MSEVLDPPVSHPVTDALEVLLAAMDDLSKLAPSGPEGELWTMSGPQLLETAAAVHQAMCRTDAVLHSVVRDIDARGAAVQAGAASTAAWLRGRLRLHPGAAKRLVVTARALHDDPTGPLVHHVDAQEPDDATAGGLARFRAAFAAGEVSAEHVSVAADALAGLPGSLAFDVVTQAEAFLAEQATQHDPKALAHLGRHLQHQLDPTAGDSLAGGEEHDRAQQTLNVRRHNDGSADVRGHLGAELTADLLAQLQPLAAPRPAAGGVKDLRTVGQRNATPWPSCFGVRPSRVPARSATGLGRPSPSPWPWRRSNVRVGAPCATLDWAGPLSAEAARRLACDAQLIPIVLGTNSEPLDVGRASYPVTQAIWRALVARDGGCAFDICDRPPEWTEAHHLIHWVDGGPTSVENTALFCDHHHHVIHHGGWKRSWSTESSTCCHHPGSTPTRHRGPTFGQPGGDLRSAEEILNRLSTDQSLRRLYGWRSPPCSVPPVAVRFCVHRKGRSHEGHNNVPRPTHRCLGWCAVIHTRAPLVALAALLGLAIPSIGYVQGASAAPSQWQAVHEEASEVFEACPGLNVLWEITVTGKSRYVARQGDLPLYEEHVTDNEVYTNLANRQRVRVIGTRVEHPLSVIDNGDGTLSYVYNHTGKSTMYADDGTLVARLFSGGIRIEKTFDHGGTLTDPSDDQLVGLNFPNGFNSTGRHDTDFCTALVGAIG